MEFAWNWLARTHDRLGAFEARGVGITVCVSAVGLRVAWRRMRWIGLGEGLEV